MAQQSVKRDGSHSLNKVLPEGAGTRIKQEAHGASGTFPSMAVQSSRLEGQLTGDGANPRSGKAGFSVEEGNAGKRVHCQAWLPEETHPAPPRLDGGAASPPPASLDEALRPLLPESANQVLTGFTKANALLNSQLSLLSNTAKEVRAQYDRVRWQEVQQVDAQGLARRLFNRQAREVVRLGERWKHVDLSGTHELTRKTRLDTSLSGTPLRVEQLSLKLLHNGTSGSATTRRQLAVTGATDLRSRSRLALEGTVSNASDTHSCSTILASDNLSYLSWGIASQHRLSKKLTLFARASADDFQGKKLILQTVHTVNLRDSISPVVAIALGRAAQAGIGWTRQLSHDPSKLDNKITLKVLASGKGAYAVNFAYKGTEG
ncbi:hypothetical protein KFL_002700160 [Klebsormidium nitens]|uniref:Uncharacterized protein n=1 Tax=Klebsormidium nitens TaxID=105231 RepID=A0A1Y1IBJ6_KLENI|nr:hypothetical protein KFL_002700160 [Klebsormidium nitens]|eukprot:GAQ86097.1 hypothetical protein KFL_002700160 [Klebsormidium nitens]